MQIIHLSQKSNIVFLCVVVATTIKPHRIKRLSKVALYLPIENKLSVKMARGNNDRVSVPRVMYVTTS